MKTVINIKADQGVKIKDPMSSMSRELENILGRFEKDIKRGKNLSHSISSSKDLKMYFCCSREA